jgi:hypothetical protein
MYPTVKYAMGHGKACTRIVVGGAPIAFDRDVDRAVGASMTTNGSIRELRSAPEASARTGVPNWLLHQ